MNSEGKISEGLNKGSVNVNGATVDYHAYRLPDGSVNVGRMTPDEYQKIIRSHMVLEFLVARSDIADKDGIVEWIENCRCEPLSDGNMGSIRLVGIEEDSVTPQFSYAAVEAAFTDKDGIQVMLSLNISDKGYPLEIDFWKVNFAPLMEYPKPEDLRLLGEPGS